MFPVQVMPKEPINPNTVNFKLGGSLRYYKINRNTEAVLAAYWYG